MAGVQGFQKKISLKPIKIHMKPVQKFILAAVAAPCALLLPAAASASTTVNVTAMDNIFASGLGSAAMWIRPWQRRRNIAAANQRNGQFLSISIFVRYGCGEREGIPRS